MDQDQAFHPCGSEANQRELEELMRNEYLRSTNQLPQRSDPTLETNLPNPLNRSTNLMATFPPPRDPRNEVLSEYTIHTIPVPPLHRSSEGIDWGFDDGMLRQLAPIEGRIPQDIADSLLYDPGRFPTPSPTHLLRADVASYLPALAIAAFPTEPSRPNPDPAASNAAAIATPTALPPVLPAQPPQPSQPQVPPPAASSSSSSSSSSRISHGRGPHRKYTSPFKRLVLHYLLTERIHDTLRGTRVIRQSKVNEAARHFAIPPSTVRDWWKSRGRYMTAAELGAAGEDREEAGHGDGTRYTARVLAWLNTRGVWREGDPDEVGVGDEEEADYVRTRQGGAGNRLSVWSLD